METAQPIIVEKKLKKLTRKQKGFVKDYIATGNGTRSALKNYDVANINTASVIAAENLVKPNIIKAISDAIPDELLVEKHLALLNKREVKRAFNADIGEWIDVETGDIDAQAVTKGLDMAYKLKGSYAAEKHATLNVNVDVVQDEDAMSLAAKLYAEAIIKQKLE